MTMKEYKTALKKAIYRVRTGKQLSYKELNLIKKVHEYVRMKDHTTTKFDWHLKNNTVIYKKLSRQNIRFDLFCQAINNHILVNYISKQYKHI